MFGLKTVMIGIAIGTSSLCAADTALADKFPPVVEMERIEQLLAEVSPERPRLFARAEDFAALRVKVDQDEMLKRLADGIIDAALRLREEEPIERTLIGKRLLMQSRRALERISVLALAWHLDGDQHHVRRAEKEMLAIARFDDWNPSHFLDVAEMALALAIGYDWLHTELPEESLRTIRTALVEKAIKLPLTTHRNAWWLRAHNNWGQVCHAGLAAAALAVLEDEPELAARTVHNAAHLVVNSMNVFSPKGSYPEGPTYWHYGTSFNVLLISALESVLGTDIGLSLAPGFAASGQYPEIATGPSGYPFNYADGGAGMRPAWPAVFWFARRFGREDLAYLENLRLERGYADGRFDRNLPGARLAAFMLIWKGATSDTPANIELPTAWHSRCPKVPIAVFTSGWGDPNAVYFGLKGGSPSAPHGHMDIGSFVLDADGVRWAIDLGLQDYTGLEARGMSLWNSRQNSDRWKIFRLNHMSHNIPLIDEQAQRADATALIDRFSDDPSFSFAQTDLTPIYESQAEYMRRGMALLDCGAVLIRDEMSGLKPGAAVRWAMMTRAKPRELGGANLQLEHQGRTLRLIQHDGDADWEQFQSDPPPSEWDAPNPGTRMVGLVKKVPADGEVTITILALPGSREAELPSSDLLSRPLADW